MPDSATATEPIERAFDRRAELQCTLPDLSGRKQYIALD